MASAAAGGKNVSYTIDSDGIATVVFDLQGSKVNTLNMSLAQEFEDTMSALVGIELEVTQACALTCGTNDPYPAVLFPAPARKTTPKCAPPSSFRARKTTLLPAQTSTCSQSARWDRFPLIFILSLSLLRENDPLLLKSMFHRLPRRWRTCRVPATSCFTRWSRTLSCGFPLCH